MTKKPPYKTIKVVLDSGVTVQVKRCSLENTDTLLELQDTLLRYYVECNGSIGAIMTDPDVRQALEASCNLLPLVSNGKEEEYLSFESIAENWEQLITLFFNSSLNDSRELEDVSAPSEVSKLHFFPYVEMIRKHVINKEEKEEKRKD